MAKLDKVKDSAGASPAVAERGTADSVVESAVTAAEVKAETAVELMTRELTAQDDADALFDEIPRIRDFVGEYHARAEKLARHFSRDAKMHGRLNRLAQAFAEFRNGLGTV